MIPAKELAHIANAKALITDAFRGRTNIEGILSAWVGEIQVAENVMWDVINLRLLDVADTDQLNQLGKIVGEPRLGRSNTNFRAAIRLRIRVNRSQGQARDLVEVGGLIVAPDGGTVEYTEYTSGFELELRGLSAPASIPTLVNEARPLGVYGVTVMATAGFGMRLISTQWGDDPFPYVLDSYYGGVTDPGILADVRGPL